jgi:hypothetical protein
VTRELLLPKGLRIDRSYRQKSVHAAGDGAASDMRASEIPAGIHIIPSGRGGGRLWSLTKPELKEIPVADGDKAMQWKFSIVLYANSGPGTATAQSTRGGGQGGSDVRVRVCVKTAQ